MPGSGRAAIEQGIVESISDTTILRWLIADTIKSDEYVISTDEKTSIQAPCRCHPTLLPGTGTPMSVERNHERRCALGYRAALDVPHARVLGPCEVTIGIVPFSRLVAHFMTTETYASTRRVLFLADNGSSHRGQASIDRMAKAWPTAKLVHLPIHTS